ncbi:MAG: rod shape-determining protein RodA [Candidatus Parcubacteria bacterium]|nr:rod shape-determining protein RodA [Candidatus Parcubacteria bacterium]
MLTHLKRTFNIDWILFFSTFPLLFAGVITMGSFGGKGNFAMRQLMWIGVSFAVFFFLSFIDFRFLRRTWVIVTLFLSGCFVLLVLAAVGSVYKGAQSWFNVGFAAFQPADVMKLIIILVLTKYFSRRHIEIANIRHIIVSGIYAFIPFVLVAAQPDFGSAIIFLFIWLGMVFVSGISKKHIILVFTLGVISFGGLWNFVFEPYQKQRIMTFIHPLADTRGAGYNSFQSTIAIGSGGVFGKGVGYGTQSRLNFLPEYQTDFIFAAFSEEWGFMGVVLLFLFFAILIWRILHNALLGETNFEILFGMGLAIYFISHFVVNVGMNIGLLPVTGITIPFMSYGGSHLLAEFTGLGILMGMRRYSRAAHRDDLRHEFLGVG